MVWSRRKGGASILCNFLAVAVGNLARNKAFSGMGILGLAPACAHPWCCYTQRTVKLLDGRIVAETLLVA